MDLFKIVGYLLVFIFWIIRGLVLLTCRLLFTDGERGLAGPARIVLRLSSVGLIVVGAIMESLEGHGGAFVAPYVVRVIKRYLTAIDPTLATAQVRGPVLQDSITGGDSSVIVPPDTTARCDAPDSTGSSSSSSWR